MTAKGNNQTNPEGGTLGTLYETNDLTAQTQGAGAKGRGGRGGGGGFSQI